METAQRFVTKNTHVQYESSILHGYGVMVKVKVFSQNIAEADTDNRAAILAPLTFFWTKYCNNQFLVKIETQSFLDCPNGTNSPSPQVIGNIMIMCEVPLF